MRIELKLVAGVLLGLLWGGGTVLASHEATAAPVQPTTAVVVSVH
jgi:hypothetical protein